MLKTDRQRQGLVRFQRVQAPALAKLGAQRPPPAEGREVPRGKVGSDELAAGPGLAGQKYPVCSKSFQRSLSTNTKFKHAENKAPSGSGKPQKSPYYKPCGLKSTDSKPCSSRRWVTTKTQNTTTGALQGLTRHVSLLSWTPLF